MAESKIVASALRTKILASKPKSLTPVEVEEWGVTIWVRELTVGQRDQFEKGQIKREKGKSGVTLETVGLKTRLVILTACDEDGEPVFTMEDFDALNNTGAAGLDKVFTIAQEVNGMKKDEDPEEILEDFGQTPNGASASV